MTRFVRLVVSISLCVGLLLIVSLHAPIQAASPEVARGVNLFGGWQGMYGGVDTFAPPKVLDYLQTKGLNTFRVGFSWEHLQPTLNGPLDATYLGKMDTLVANARARGQRVAFVPLPGLYKGQNVNTTAVPLTAFTDLWVKLATHYNGESGIWGYDLINEPNMGDTWNTIIAPAAIKAIRTVDTGHPILVPTSTGGYGHYFTSHLAGLPMQDPSNNLIYEAHFYFDSPPNGQYVNGFDVPNGDLMIGVERAQGFVNWCVTNNQRCFAGEYGIPQGWKSGNQTCNYDGGTNKDPRWLTVLDNFLTYLDQNTISGAYWASGPYGDINSMGPFCDSNGNFYDAPQVAILTKHLGSTNPSPIPTILPTIAPSPTPFPTSLPSPTPKSTPTLPGDINNDGIVDISDYGLLVRDFFKSGSLPTDLNGDMLVDISDYGILVQHFFMIAPGSTSTPNPINTPLPPVSGTIQGESFSSDGIATRVIDDTAALNGKALELIGNTTVTGNVRGPFTKLTIRAKSVVCSGYGHILVKVNGQYVFDNNISSATYTDFVTSDFSRLSLGAQSYPIEIIYNTPYSTASCTRKVVLDQISMQ